VPYTRCCARFLDGGEPVPDAEHLMRSRYTAFVRQRADWLLATWHAAPAPRRAPRRRWISNPG